MHVVRQCCDIDPFSLLKALLLLKPKIHEGIATMPLMPPLSCALEPLTVQNDAGTI